jgi:hypothetical protein
MENDCFPRTLKFEMLFLKFEHSDLAISEVSHYEFLRGHFSIS